MEFTIEHIFQTSAAAIYSNWLNSAGHSEMTGADAIINAKPGSSFTAWDNYISGKLLELTPNAYIKMSWRTSEFQPKQNDSVVEVFLTERSKGETLLTLRHSSLLENDDQYKQGWIDFYFTPMDAFFKQ